MTRTAESTSSESLQLLENAFLIFVLLAANSIVVQFKQAIQAADTSRPITGNTVQAHFFHNGQCDCRNPSQSAACSNCQKFGDNAAAAMDVQSFSCRCLSQHPAKLQCTHELLWLLASCFALSCARALHRRVRSLREISSTDAMEGCWRWRELQLHDRQGRVRSRSPLRTYRSEWSTAGRPL